jgi:nucleoid DNA-binding protein
MQDIKITKEKIALYLKKQLGLSSLLCEDITTEVFSELLKLIKDQKKVSLRNFGTWKIIHKNTRPGFNIKNGTKVSIEARNVLRFVPSKAFKKDINRDLC